MKVSEWKLANSVIVDDENYDLLNSTQHLYSGAEITKGSKFMDAILEVDEFGAQTIYLLDSEIGLFNIVNDPEWDEMLPTAQQKFTVTPKE
jgi:16S rRNA U1498 N3-methylase RsmE